MLLNKIKKTKHSSIKSIIETRLHEFKSFESKSNKEWFSELCFCLLTANSKAKTALNIQKELGAEGFCNCIAGDIRDCIIRNKHRFHNNKTNFIIEARKNMDIKSIVQSFESEFDARLWLVENIKGLGFKEASHFLRNVGYKNVAIIDRHVINLLLENGYISKKPKTISKKLYLEIEEKLLEIADELKMSQAELDLYLWYLKTGKVLK